MKKILRSSLLQRISWTVAILFVYMLGKYIPLATFPLNVGDIQSKLVDSLNAFAMVTGGELSRLNLFSLGLGPWMTSMILWRFISAIKINKYFTEFQNNMSQMLLLLVIAVIQAVGYLSLIQTTSITFYQQLVTVVVMVSGSFVLMWLANILTQNGLGGSSAIIATSMILNFITTIATMDASLLQPGFIGLMVAIVLALIFVTVVVYLAEYRVPIKRVTIDSRLVKTSYLPIRITPAGGMPFMYALTLMSLPVLFIQAASLIFPENTFLATVQGQLSVGNLPGIILYNVVLFILSYGFAYFNLDPTEVAENMQRNGDYIETVRPGRATQAYLTKYLNRLAFIGAVYTCFMGGLPLLIVWYFDLGTNLGMMINQIYIVTTMMLTIVEQVNIIQSWKQYKDII